MLANAVVRIRMSANVLHIKLILLDKNHAKLEIQLALDQMIITVALTLVPTCAMNLSKQRKRGKT